MIDFSSEKYSGSTGHMDTGIPGTSRNIFSEDPDDGTRTRNPCSKAVAGKELRCQSQLRNDKITMMQYTNWINSTLSQQQLLSCIAQWLEHSVCNRGVASSSSIISRHALYPRLI